MSDGATPPSSPAQGSGNSSKEAVQAKIKCVTSPDAEPIEEVRTLVPGGSPVEISIPGTGTIKLSANFLSDGDEGSEAGDSIAPVQGACECNDRADREAAAVSSTLKQIVPLRKMLSRIRKKVEVLSTNINGYQPTRVECGSWYGGTSTKIPPVPQLPMSSGPPEAVQSCGRTQPPPAYIEDPPTNFQSGQSTQERPYVHQQYKGFDRPYSDQHRENFDHPHAAHHQIPYDHPHSDHHNQSKSAHTYYLHSDHRREGYDQQQYAPHHESPYGHPHSAHHEGNFNQNNGTYLGHDRGRYDQPQSGHHDSPYRHPHSDHHREDYNQLQSAQPYSPRSEHHAGGYDHPHATHHTCPYGHPHSDHHNGNFDNSRGSPYGHPNSEQYPHPPKYQDAPSEDPRSAPPVRLRQEPPVVGGMVSTPYNPRGPYMAPPNDPLFCKPPPEINKPMSTPPEIDKPNSNLYAVRVDMDSTSKIPCAPCPFRQADDAASRLYDNHYTMKYGGTGVQAQIRDDAPPCCVPQMMGRCEPCVTTGPRRDACAPCEYRKEPTC